MYFTLDIIQNSQSNLGTHQPYYCHNILFLFSLLCFPQLFQIIFVPKSLFNVYDTCVTFMASEKHFHSFCLQFL